MKNEERRIHFFSSEPEDRPKPGESPAPQYGAFARDAPLTMALLLTTGLINLYLYTAGFATPSAGGNIAPHFYYFLVLVSALFSTRFSLWLIWLATSASNVLFAATHPENPSLMLTAAVFAPAAGVIAIVIRRLRIAHATYQQNLRALDAANADVRKRLTEFSALFEISQRAGLTFDLEELFRASMECISRRLQMYRGTLSIFDPQTQEVKVKYAYGLTPHQIASSRYRLGEGIYGTVMATGEPMAVPNIGDEPLFLRWTDASSEVLEITTRSVAFLCVPIKMEGRTVGVLSVDRGPVDQRTLGDDLNFLTILASIFGQALKIQEMIEAMVEQERLAVLGKMATSVAHEVRNPLGGIRGAAQLLQMSLSGKGEGRKAEGGIAEPLFAEAGNYARVIIQEVDRLNRVVEELLHFGNERPTNRQKHRLPELLEHVLFLTASIAESNGVEVVRDFAPDLPTLVMDGDQITQVFLNLVRNALEAMPHGGTLHLIAGASERESTGISGKGPLRYVEVQVCDTGEGIPPHLRGEIFNPLYTTKQKGTGIGLALTKRLVEEHGGYIEVGDHSPRGMRFTVVLPVWSPGRSRQ